ncbi:MAG: hypothetical protein F4Z01_02945 [Gammaproteobacteria bacterium]|nr:hypothetical protein [Gammaproteobacteria bacterium]MYF39106.1 hypothetical protein [Gammaproteobacteria bacterium]
MSDAPVIVVYLRQPDTSNPYESRDDPYWEFGSFGCTGCHAHNLMNLRKLEEIRGNRLAFVQGGKGEIRLVYLTPRIDVRFHLHRGEAIWQPAEMPLAFSSAPVLINNDFQSDVPSVIDLMINVNRSTPCGKFASKFRSRRTPLPADIAKELISVYEQFSNQQAYRAKCYIEALPYMPPKIDRNRQTTYKRHIAYGNDTRTRKRILCHDKSVHNLKTLKRKRSC